MTLGVKRLVGIILLLTISCGTKRKALKKTQIETVSKTITNIVKTDSSITYLNISELQIVQRDTTKPIVVKDSKGNITTFYNVKEINTKENKSVIKTAKKDSITQTATVGTTIQVEEKTKTKEPIKFNYWLLILPILAYIILRKFLKTYFVWL
jgi:ribosomal protein S19